jgi:hypothetical protein
LGQNGFVTDNSQIDAVALGFDTPMVQHQHRDHPDTAADALHADVPAFQLCRSFDLRMNDKSTGKPID